MYTKRFLVTLGAMFLVLGVSVVNVSASSIVVYNNIPDPFPSNVPSMGVEAYSMPEIGTQVQLAGTERANATVDVLMSSWACQQGTWVSGDCLSEEGATFTHPITLNVYAVNLDNSPGTKLATVTQTFSMPYRPSTDLLNCTEGRWFNGSACFNGKAFTITFNLAGVTLPDKAIVGVAYNTSHNGYNPIGTQNCNATIAGCAYDSLNVGLTGNPTVGTVLPTNKDIYLNSSYGGFYCDSGLAGTGIFRLDAGCWEGYLPGIKVVTSTPSAESCKNDGWKSLHNPSFKNQGTCVSYFQSNLNAGKRI